MLFACDLSLEEARASVSEQTGLDLDLHESLFWGGDYYLGQTPDGKLILHVNSDPIDGEPISTTAVPSSWVVAVVSIPGLVLNSPWTRTASS